MAVMESYNIKTKHFVYNGFNLDRKFLNKNISRTKQVIVTQ